MKKIYKTPEIDVTRAFPTEIMKEESGKIEPGNQMSNENKAFEDAVLQPETGSVNLWDD